MQHWEFGQPVGQFYIFLKARKGQDEPNIYGNELELSGSVNVYGPVLHNEWGSGLGALLAFWMDQSSLHGTVLRVGGGLASLPTKHHQCPQYLLQLERPSFFQTPLPQRGGRTKTGMCFTVLLSNTVFFIVCFA